MKESQNVAESPPKFPRELRKPPVLQGDNPAGMEFSIPHAVDIGIKNQRNTTFLMDHYGSPRRLSSLPLEDFVSQNAAKSDPNSRMVFCEDALEFPGSFRPPHWNFIIEPKRGSTDERTRLYQKFPPAPTHAKLLALVSDCTVLKSETKSRRKKMCFKHSNIPKCFYLFPVVCKRSQINQ